LRYSIDGGIGLIAGAREARGMKKQWLGGLLLAVSLALLLSGGVWAEDVRPEIDSLPEPPMAAEGLYVTTEDNEDNDGTGVADGDMGYPDPPWMCATEYDDEYPVPIEFKILVDAAICSGGELSVASYAFEEDDEEVYINGHFLGYMPEVEWGWNVYRYQVPEAALNEGENLVQVRVVGDCGSVAWGALAIEPCELEEEFVPEPGSMLLLGSGLAGLAGYATLRLRSGHALRWRTRE
jgi:hypothetical protein